MRITVLLGFLILGAADVGGAEAPAPTAPVSLYGITLGDVLSLPRCADRARTTPQMCYRNSLDRFPAPEAKLIFTPTEIRFADGARPAAAKYETFNVLIRNDRVEEITILTRGLSVQTEVQRQLEQRFGRPSNFSVEKRQNSFGATFEIIEAVWVRPGDLGIVRFYGALSRVDTGTITAATSAAEKFRDEQFNAKRAAEPRL